jgi:hypothetical protein
MNDLMTPPERELPGHDVKRRALVAAVAGPPHPAARFLPAAAAAGVALIAAASVFVLTGSEPGGYVAVPVGSAPAGGSDSALLRDCLGGQQAPSAIAGAPAVPPLAGARVLVSFTDGWGRIALAGQPGLYALCSVDNSGTLDSTETRRNVQGIPPGMYPTPGDPAWGNDVVRLGTYVDWGSVQPIGLQTDGPDNPYRYSVSGTVRADVARVTITWTGHPPVRAALDNGFFLGKLEISPAGEKSLPALGFVVRAYDAAGHLLGTLNKSHVPNPEPTS